MTRKTDAFFWNGGVDDELRRPDQRWTLRSTQGSSRNRKVEFIALNLNLLYSGRTTSRVFWSEILYFECFKLIETLS